MLARKLLVLLPVVALAGCAQQDVQVSAASQAVASPFYVDPGSNPANWVRAHPNDPRAAKIKQAVAQRPMGRWFGGWSGDVRKAADGYVAAAQRAGKTPILVPYNITDRDCSGHSSGGAGSPAKYRAWIEAFAAGIGTRPAVVVLEPDAVAQIGCLPTEAARKSRRDLLKHAVNQLKAKAPKAKVYLDGGNARWHKPADIAALMHSAGLKNVRGFALNVSNYFTTADTVKYAKEVNAALSAKYGYTRTFVVDTSRNGKGGRPGDWCNPAGAKLGTVSQMGGGAEMLLWVKVPGDSDGKCGVAPNTPAGQFSPDLAMRLIDGR
ncbi:glycoside hydrolase family 6 protein [Actinomadura kijaniata]|uniref:Glucanase n=1 Tax=Actinomadura namibiensis TaxID=182080 RepID=A0A7W3LTU2_ACTNM|nr:glycoside hydrolase family 6 protein [Actinomadura namibiensis]MBA8954184.1 endoglucanase [Actinomadura namibiensis]